jgi:hypothetical protein
MTALCVQIKAMPDGTEFIAPADDCSAGLVVVDAGTYQAMLQSPFLITMDQAPGFMLALLGLFVAAWIAKIPRRVLD